MSHFNILKIYLVNYVGAKIKTADEAIVAGAQESCRIVFVPRQTVDGHSVDFELLHPLILIVHLVNIPKT